MVMRGSRARGTPSPPALVWLSYNTLSVRNSKILQSPLPSSQQGQTGGGQRTVLTATLPGPTLPTCHRLPTSLGPFPLPLGALHLRTLTMFLVKLYLFPLPTSQLCPSLCPNILSILIKGEACLSFLRLSRLKVLQGKDCVLLIMSLCKHGTQPTNVCETEAVGCLITGEFLPPGLCTCHPHCPECWSIFTPSDSFEYRYVYKVFHIHYIITVTETLEKGKASHIPILWFRKLRPKEGK